MALGYLRAYAFDLGAGLAAFERTLELNPNHADAWCLFADLKVFDSRPFEAIECARKAFRLNPRPPSQYYWLLGWSQYAAGQYAEAAVTLSHPVARDAGCQRIRAAALAQLGRTEEAGLAAREFMAVIPRFSIAEWAKGQPFRLAADLQHFVDGYRKAGLPG
jgi:adenylate cyclase